MKKVIFFLAVAALPFAVIAQKTNGKPIAANTAAAGKWNLDKSHSSVKFTVKHLVV